jgi:hypothetical protein
VWAEGRRGLLAGGPGQPGGWRRPVASRRREPTRRPCSSPPPRGGLLWYTAFAADILLPAKEAAGWPIEVYEDTWHQWNGDEFV